MSDILSRVLATVQRHGMFARGGRAVLGVSGGPDSLALLYLMRDLSEKRTPALKLHVGHLHHGIRGVAADEDARFVERASSALGLPCTVERVDVPGLARERGVGVEVASRDARYAFLQRLARALAADWIALGHQADDQVETVLMRAMRGAGPRGMGAIPYARPVNDVEHILIVRPLLDCTREELEAFLRSRGLEWRLDSTNLSPRYLRNRVRASVIPQLKRAWPGDLRHDLCSLAAAAQRLQSQAEKLSASVMSRQPAKHLLEYVEVGAEWLRNQPPAIRPELLRRWLNRVRIPHRPLAAEHYSRIDALLESPEGTLTLPGGFLACRCRGLFILCSPRPASADTFRCELKVPGTTPMRLFSGIIETVIMEGREHITTEELRSDDESVELMDLEKVRKPLSVRFQRPGDRMRPLGAPGSRKLQDIFTDLCVPRWKRQRIPLVTMRDKPIWIVGHRLCDEVKLTKKTRSVLRLRFLQSL